MSAARSFAGLHYAQQVADEDGGRRVFIVTDRPISFWEGSTRPRSIDDPFTLIEIHIGHGGSGEGKMSIATRITVDRKRDLIELENYSGNRSFCRMFRNARSNGH